MAYTSTSLNPYPDVAKSHWPYRLRPDLPADEVSKIRSTVEKLASTAQYGWGHTIDFGPFQMPGLLRDEYLRIAGLFDAWGWWPESLDRMTVADVGCFTGGLSLLMASLGAARVIAVDEVPAHLAQCSYLSRVFNAGAVECVESSLYQLTDHIAPASVDLLVLSGVLYHLSDMLVGLLILQKLLKPGGVLLIESNAVEDFEHSYANFGRFTGGMWWQPTALCIQDMCEFMGFEKPDVRFYVEGRCLARAVRPANPRVPFKRGMNWHFESLKDDVGRPTDHRLMAPAPVA
jgi:SAM-dependent methyltransferase